jgi:hypothetical protein
MKYVALKMRSGVELKQVKNILRVFENRVLRRIYGPKRDEVTEAGGKMHNEEMN